MDDDLYIQELYENMFALAGHEVVGKAGNGQQAVDTYPLFQPRPDVVIMDHRMPVMNGLDATRAILASDTAARIVMISADPSARPHATGLGVAAFLEKPFTLDALMRVVAACTAEPRAPRQRA